MRIEHVPRRVLERGSALIVSLIMLLLITMFALSTFNMGRSSLEIAGNAQQTNAMVMAGNDAIQEAISTTRMFLSPNAIFITPCTTANTRCFDTNGNGTYDVSVALTPAPTCVQAHSIPNVALNLADSNDAGCTLGTQQTFGVEASTGGASLCANSQWVLNAVAQDNVTQATATVTQGVTVRVSNAVVFTACP
jgi:Tfp pilus assembly protein PilX